MDTVAGEPRRHLLIAGPGRSGTTLLVRVLSALGMETHLDTPSADVYDEVANAGLEDELGAEGAPYVVKSPFAYQMLDHVLASGTVALDHAIVPVRNLRDAAASRVIAELEWMNSSPDLARVADRSGGMWENQGRHPGGVTYSLEPLDQERILAVGFARLMETLVKHDVPTILLDFPRFATDPEYLADRLRPIRPDIGVDQVAAVLDEVVDESKIRVGRELHGQAAAGDAGADPRPTIEELDSVALRRMLLKLQPEYDHILEEFKNVRNALFAVQESARQAAEDARAKQLELRRQLESAEAKAKRLKGVVARKNRRLADLRNSKTMRYTAPIRKAFGVMRSGR